MTTIRSSRAQKKEIITLREQIQQNTGKTPEQLYEEREKRVRDSIFLKQPDRIPLFVFPDPSVHYNLPQSAAYYDPLAWRQALIREVLDFEPDMTAGSFSTSGESLATLDVKNKLWPGGPLPPDYEYQFIEREYLKEDEYDLFLSDPTDFMIRYFLPRMYGALSPLSKLPPLGVMFQGFEGIIPLFATPEYKQLARSLFKAAREMEKFRKTIDRSVNNEIARVRVEAIERLLLDPRLTVKEISNILGFKTPGYLGFLFKKYKGIGPTDFRKRKNQVETNSGHKELL